MGKKNKPLANKESYQRINYLYQAAHLCLQMRPVNIEQCRFYVQTLKTVAEKHVLRLEVHTNLSQMLVSGYCTLQRHPDIKRNICKKCYMLLVPGISSITRNKRKGKKRHQYAVISCLECGNVKRFLLHKDHRLWVEKPEAWLSSLK